MKNFFKMSYLDFKGHIGPFQLEEFLTFHTMYPFLTLVFYCLLAGYAFQTTDLTQWVIGNSYLLCTNACIFTLGGSFSGERSYGRIRSIICSPMSKFQFMLQKSFLPCLVSVVTTSIGFIAGSVLFGISITQINFGLYLILLMVAMLGACGLGLFVGTFGLLTDQILFLTNTLSFVILIFTGANFPVSQLPLLGRVVAQILPLTRSIEASKMLFFDYDGRKFISLLIGEFLIAIIYLLLAVVMVKYAERKAIRKGSLELF